MKSFTLNDLRTGDIVLSTKGSYGIVLKGTPVGDMISWFVNAEHYSINKFRTFSMFNYDLSFKYDNDNKIIKVWRTKDTHYIGVKSKPEYDFFNVQGFRLIYEDTLKEVTMDEVEKKFGCKVKIVNR